MSEGMRIYEENEVATQNVPSATTSTTNLT
jgi:hypothetical protein